MVSFTCGRCQDVVKKPKVLSHAHSCGASGFTCVDCMEVFDLNTVKAHTACISETEKYQGKWRQKTTTTQRRRDSDSDDDNKDNNKDNNNNNINGHLMRPPRAPMDFSSDSDSDDDDAWVKAKKNPTTPAEKKKEEKKEKNTSPQKRARSHTSTQSSPITTTTTTTTNHNNNNNNNNNNKEKETTSSSSTHVNSKRVKHEPLALPRAMTTADCVVPSFVLGTDEEVATVAAWILRDEAAEKREETQQLTLRELAKKMVERYNARIAKHLRQAIQTAIKNGKLREENGVVMVASSQ